MPLCNICGKTIDEGGSFCAYCGAPAAPAVSPANVTAPPVYPASQPMAAPGRNTFLNSYLVIVVFAAFFLGLLAFGNIVMPDGFMFNPRSFGLIFVQGVCFLGPIAFATALSARAKGLDLSIGPVMALSSAIIGIIEYSLGSPVLGIAIALLACAVIGLINGAIITYLRVPAIVVTIITGIIARCIVNLLLNGMTLPVSDSIRMISQYQIGELSLGGLIILIVTFLAAFLMIMLTKLGVPTYKRDKKPSLSYMFAYMASSLIAAVAGLFMASRLGAASPIAGSGYEPFIVLVFACVIGSRAMDNRFAPAVYTLVPVLFFSIFQFIFSVAGADVFFQTLLGGILTIIFIAVAFLSRRFSPSYGDD